MNKSIILIQILFSIVLAVIISNKVNDVLVYTLIFSLAINECSKIENLIRQINRSFLCFKNIDLVLINKEIDDFGKINHVFKINIDINGFSYNEKPRTLLNNVKISLNKGDTVLLSGDNGSGKSTLIKMLTRNIDIYDGEIKINDINIHNIDKNSLYSNMLYVSQNDYFVNGTLFEYLKLSSRNDEITKKGVEEIFQYLNLDLNLDYVTDVFGDNLSGGQKKKLQLARIILSMNKASLFILDEIDAGLDNKAIKKYEQIINDLAFKKDKIIVVIQHTDMCIKYNKYIKL